MTGSSWRNFAPNVFSGDPLTPAFQIELQPASDWALHQSLGRTKGECVCVASFIMSGGRSCAMVCRYVPEVGHVTCAYRSQLYRCRHSDAVAAGHVPFGANTVPSLMWPHTPDTSVSAHMCVYATSTCIWMSHPAYIEVSSKPTYVRARAQSVIACDGVARENHRFMFGPRDPIPAWHKWGGLRPNTASQE